MRAFSFRNRLISRWPIQDINKLDFIIKLTSLFRMQLQKFLSRDPIGESAECVGAFWFLWFFHANPLFTNQKPNHSTPISGMWFDHFTPIS
jgi:hypothetical protein